MREGTGEEYNPPMATDTSRDATAALEDLQLSHDRQLAVYGLILMLVPAIWFIRSDFELAGGDPARLRERLISRAFLIAVPLHGILLLRAAKTREQYRHAAVIASWAMAICVLVIAALRPAGSGVSLRSPFLNIAVMYFMMPNTAWQIIPPPMALSLGLIVLRLTWLSGGTADVGGDVVSILVLNAVGVLTAFGRARLDVATHNVVGELRTLRGIIPICSYCRNVRTEVGQWQKLDRYVRNHTDVDFSHGICPDCMRQHHPDVVKRA